MKIWICGSSSRSGSRNAWTRIKNVNRASRLSNFWNFFDRWDPNDFLSGAIGNHGRNLVISLWPGDKATIKWRHSGSPRPKKFRVQKSAGKVLTWVDFLGSRRHPPQYLPKGQTVNAECYSSLLVQLKDILKEKRCGKFSKGVVFLHDNVPAHRPLATQKKLAFLGFQCLDHPLYSQDLAPLDYHLFPGLKNQLNCSHFSSDAEAIAVAETWLDGQVSEFFLSGLQKLRATG